LTYSNDRAKLAASGVADIRVVTGGLSFLAALTH